MLENWILIKLLEIESIQKAWKTLYLPFSDKFLGGNDQGVHAVHNGKIQARKEALHVILGTALVFLGVIGSFKLIGLYRTETVCFRAGLTIFI